MQRLSKKILCLFMILAMTFGVVSGCAKKEEKVSKDGPAKEQQAKEAKKDDQQKKKIVWWTHQRHDMDFMKEKIDAFMEENPDIEVEYVVQTDNYGQNLELSFQSGQAPDIFSCGPADYLVKRDMVSPLDEFLTDEIRARFGDLLKVNLNNYVDGKTYSMPNVGNIFRYVYNKELFEKAGLVTPPKTLSEMVEYARKMTEVGKADGQYGFAINFKTPGGAFERAIDKIAQASGLHPYNYQEGKYDFGSMKPIILAFKEMYDKGYMFPGVEGLSMDPLRSQFAEGKIGSYLSAHWEVGVYNNQFPAKMDWAAAPVPIVDGTEGKGKVGASKVGYWQAMSSTCQDKEAAWRVLEYIYSEKILIEYHELGLGSSIVPSIVEKAKAPEAKGAEYFQYDKTVDTFYEPTPMRFGYGANYGLKPEGKEYFDVFLGVILGLTEIDKAIEDLNKRYNAAYDLAIKEGELERIVIPDYNPAK